MCELYATVSKVNIPEIILTETHYSQCGNQLTAKKSRIPMGCGLNILCEYDYFTIIFLVMASVPASTV